MRAFYYLLLICIRESRHNKSLAQDLPKIKATFGVAVADFLTGINGGEAGIHAKFLKAPPACAIGPFVDCLRWQFYHSKWTSGYGGKAWGTVADCLVRFVTGEYSAEMMLDTVWTLAHNNGPIFNKAHVLLHVFGTRCSEYLMCSAPGRCPRRSCMIRRSRSSPIPRSSS